MKAVVLAAAAALFMMSGVSAASADDFTFSIVGTNAPGTVTGEILGLGAGTSTPTEVRVFSSTQPSGTYPVDYTPLSSSYYSGSFTDAGGVITAADFAASLSSGLAVYLDYDQASNGFGFQGTSNGVLNSSGFAGAIYQLAPAAVSAAPEPGTWALMLGGIGILGAVIRVANPRRREDELKSIATA